MMLQAHIWNDRTIGAYFFDENVTGSTNLSMLEIFLYPISEDMHLAHRRMFWFQLNASFTL
jgi:hypothetical protein